MRFTWGGWVVALLLSGAASAQGRLVVVASGDCRDPDLLSDTRLLSNELRGRLKDGLLEEEALRERLAPPPPGVWIAEPAARRRRGAVSQAKFDPAETQVNEALHRSSGCRWARRGGSWR